METGKWKLETGKQKLETGNRKLEVRERNVRGPAIDSELCLSHGPNSIASAFSSFHFPVSDFYFLVSIFRLYSNFRTSSTALSPPKAKELETATAHRHFSRLVGNVVQVALGVRRGVIRRGRNDCAFDGHGRRRQFDGPRGAHGVAMHRFCGADRQLASVIAEHLLDDLRFGDVVQARAGAVGIDVIHFVRGNAGFLERHAHRASRPIDGGLGNVAGV